MDASFIFFDYTTSCVPSSSSYKRVSVTFSDFAHQAKNDARTVLAQHGFKLPSSDQISTKRVDAAKLEVRCLALS